MNDKYEIVCYGDSNTHGTVARWNSEEPGRRFDCDTRWTCVLQKELGDSFYVVEEGLPFRTTIYTEAPDKPYRNGLYLLDGILETHKPIDMVILMLGTNDMKQPQRLPEEEQGHGIETLANAILGRSDIGRGGRAPDVLIVSPPALAKADAKGRTELFYSFHGEYGIQQSKTNPQIYERIAHKLGCYYLNSQNYVVTDPGDGVHITKESHILLGKALAKKVLTISGAGVKYDT